MCRGPLNSDGYDLVELNADQRETLERFWGAWQDDLTTLRIVDPACGSGAFLIEAFEQLPEHLRGKSAPLDMPSTAILFPVVFDSTTNKIDYYRKVAMFGSVEVQACRSRAEAKFGV